MSNIQAAPKAFKKFRFDDYWRTWERILIRSQGAEAIVLSLTPINGFKVGNEREIIQVASELVRGVFVGEKGDRDEIPTDVINHMKRFLGSKRTERMLNFDYLSLFTVDQVKAACKASNGGGVPVQYVLDHAAGKATFHKST